MTRLDELACGWHLSFLSSINVHFTFMIRLDSARSTVNTKPSHSLGILQDLSVAKPVARTRYECDPLATPYERIHLSYTDAKKYSMEASHGNLIYAYKAQAAIAKTTDKPMAIEFTTETEVAAPAPVPLGAAVPDC